MEFWDQVEQTDTCWIWKGRLNDDGYGVYGSKLAHRVSIAAHDGSVVLHECDNRACVRPEHLRLGTHRDNMADMRAKGRAARLAGEHNGRAKLRLVQVVGVHNSTLSHCRLARDLGVHEREIRRIRRGERWKEISWQS